MSVKDKFWAFLREEEGLTTVEYAVAGALVVLVIIGAFTALGGNIDTVIQNIADALVGK